jgi:hypothetical protein
MTLISKDQSRGPRYRFVIKQSTQAAYWFQDRLL